MQQKKENKLFSGWNKTILFSNLKFKSKNQEVVKFWISQVTESFPRLNRLLAVVKCTWYFQSICKFAWFDEIDFSLWLGSSLGTSFVGSGFNYLWIHLYPFLFSNTPFISTKDVATVAGGGGLNLSGNPGIGLETIAIIAINLVFLSQVPRLTWP